MIKKKKGVKKKEKKEKGRKGKNIQIKFAFF